MLSCDCCDKWACLACIKMTKLKSKLTQKRMKEVSKNTIDIAGSLWFCSSCLRFVLKTINDTQIKSKDDEDEDEDEDVYSEKQVQEIKRKFLEMKMQHKKETDEKLEQKDKRIEELEAENIKLSKTLVDTLQQYETLKNNFTNESNRREAAEFQIMEMDREFCITKQ